MTGQPRQQEHDFWQGEDIYGYDGRETGNGWRLKVCQLTMDVLVCVTDIHRDPPDELPGQLFFDGEPWVTEFVAFVSLFVVNRDLDQVSLYADICLARYQALEWLRKTEITVGERARQAQEHYDRAVKGLHETRESLGVSDGSPARLPS